MHDGFLTSVSRWRSATNRGIVCMRGKEVPAGTCDVDKRGAARRF